MSRPEELIRRAQAGEKDASEQLVQENAGLIWSVAMRFLGRGAEAEGHCEGRSDSLMKSKFQLFASEVGAVGKLWKNF